MAFYDWKPYVPVAERRAKAKREMDKLRKKGKAIQPIQIEGRTIAHSFWGKGWCDHLESFSDFENRLPRGRTYVRNGSVCHLEIQPGRIEAYVCGSELYKIAVEIAPLKPALWKKVKEKCRGQIGSMLELLQGKLSAAVMRVVTDRKEGLFPQPGEIKMKCSCPDWATMCKHVAAVLYGVGSLLDTRPELLFILRGVEAQELISAKLALPKAAAGSKADTLAVESGGLESLFGIEFDDAAPTAPAPAQGGKASSPGPRTSSSALSSPAPAKARAKAPTPPAPAPPRGASIAAVKTKTTSGKGVPGKAVPGKAVPAPLFDAKKPTGKAIARLRAHLGLSVAALANQLGVTSASIYRWESSPGRLRLQPRTLEALAALQANGVNK